MILGPSLGGKKDKSKSPLIFLLVSYFHLQLVIVHHLVADGGEKKLLILLQPKARLVVQST